MNIMEPTTIEATSILETITEARSKGEDGCSVVYVGKLSDLNLDELVQQNIIKYYTIESRGLVRHVKTQQPVSVKVIKFDF